jgi:medium-chain acyl-[acyl-carrier-protein] hydrolase
MAFETRHKIGLDEVNKELFMTNRAIIVAFQNTGSFHSDSINYGVLDIPKTHLTWFVLDWKVEIIKRPKYGDEIKIITWGRNAARCFSYRDFEIYVNNELYVRATSKWVLLNTQKKTYEEVSQELLDLYGNDDTKSTFPEKRLNHMKVLDKYDNKVKISIRKSDLDFNGHVNNVKYFDYLTDYANAKEYDNFRVTYRKEIKAKEKVYLCYSDDKFCIIDDEGVVKTIIECK